MFTGIIEGLGTIESISGNLFTITHPFGEPFEEGESVALSGMCATVLDSTDDYFQVEIIKESRDLTVFGSITEGGLVNLERSAIIGARNSGHNVTGHIDQVGELIGIDLVEDYYLLRVKIESQNSKLVVHKGSIALNGISLTVSGVGEDWFEVSIISHTWKVTNLQELSVGHDVNIEFDIFGKYVLNQQN